MTRAARGGAAVATCVVISLTLAACSGAGVVDGARGPSGAAVDVSADGAAGGPPVGLDVVRSLEFPPLRFDPPEPVRFQLSNGVTVFFIRDRALPLLDVFVEVRGGYMHFGRDRYAAAAALMPLMRNGGTTGLPPDSVDARLERNAFGMSTSTNGGRIRLGISALSHQIEEALDLWSDILLRPRFDSAAVERWRLQELEAMRRLPDLPGSLAVVEFNRIFYGDDPNGWRMREQDLAPERLRREELRALHRVIVCPEHAIIGAAGDVEVGVLREALERALAGWVPCGSTLPSPAPPVVAADPSVYVIHRPGPQSTVVVGLPGGVLMDESDDYFASRLANWVLGGSGFTSRLMTRLRTEEGLAYSAASIWGAARRHERVLGAITHTKGESTVEAARLMLDTFEEAAADPPGATELDLAREAIVNGFVFGFTSTIGIVSRQVGYLADGLPADWLTRYLAGIRDVDSTAVASLLRRTIDLDSFTILIVGDTTRFDPSALGPVHHLPAR